MSDSDREAMTDDIHFRGAFGVFVLGPDDVEFRTGLTSGRSIVVSDSERRGILGVIIERMLSPQTMQSRPWNEAERELLSELIPQLRESGIVDCDGDTKTADLKPGPSFPTLNKPLTQASIGILGHGVLGEAVRTLLRDMPCGPLSVIESSSIAKKCNSKGADAQKQSSEKDTVSSERPILRPTHHAEWIEVLKNYDWIIAAQDCFEPEELAALNKAALQLGLPWSLVCFDGYEGWVGPTFIPAQTACFGCFRQRLAAGAAEPKHIFFDPGVKTYRLPSPSSDGHEARPWVSLIASMFVLDVIAAMDGKGFTLSHFLIVHRLNLTFQRESVLRLPRCDDCSPRRGAPRPNVFAHILPTRRPSKADG